MFGRKGLGDAAAASQPAQSPSFGSTPGPGEAFPRAFGQGQPAGSPGPAPADQPIRQEAVVRQLVEGMREVRATADRLSAVASSPIGPLHLLPPELWEGRFGAPLLGRLDLSPYRPWNTIYLPLDAEGAFALDLPVRPERFLPDHSEVEAKLDLILDLLAGKENPEASALELRLASVRENCPYLFPADRTNVTPEVRQARSNVRALALAHASDSRLVDMDVIVSSHETFLVDPERQLIS
jgi:hypothetical protein